MTTTDSSNTPRAVSVLERTHAAMPHRRLHWTELDHLEDVLAHRPLTVEEALRLIATTRFHAEEDSFNAGLEQGRMEGQELADANAFENGREEGYTEGFHKGYNQGCTDMEKRFEAGL